MVLCGHSDQRLWPVARDSMPMHLWPLVSGRTLVQEALLRASGHSAKVTFAPPVVVCGEQCGSLTAVQVAAAGAHGARLLIEPMNRNTAAAAAAAAALLLTEEGSEPMLWIIPAGTIVTDADALHALLPTALTVARRGRIVVFAIAPSAPDFSGRPIELGPPLPGVEDVFEISPFGPVSVGISEGGSLEGAQRLADSGMYLATATTLLRELTTYSPQITLCATQAVANRRMGPDFIRLDSVAFAACPSVDLQQVIASQPEGAAVMPAAVEGAEVGTWRALWHVSPKDPDGNVVLGDAMLVQSSDCYVRSDGLLTVVLGLKNVVVVTTEDAVLAMHRDSAAEVGEIGRHLDRQNREQPVSYRWRKEHWGYEEALAAHDRYRVRRVVLDPGAEIPLQRHLHRAEHWYAVQGTALVTRDGAGRLLPENECVEFSAGCVFGVANPGQIPLVLIVVQVGAYMGEDEMEPRFESRLAPS